MLIIARVWFVFMLVLAGCVEREFGNDSASPKVVAYADWDRDWSRNPNYTPDRGQYKHWGKRHKCTASFGQLTFSFEATPGLDKTPPVLRVTKNGNILSNVPLLTGSGEFDFGLTRLVKTAGYWANPKDYSVLFVKLYEDKAIRILSNKISGLPTEGVRGSCQVSE